VVEWVVDWLLLGDHAEFVEALEVVKVVEDGQAKHRLDLVPQYQMIVDL